MPNENVEISSLAMTVSDEPQTDSRAGAAEGACSSEFDGMSTRPVLSLVTGFEELFDTIEDQWQERALCAQTDPEAFFLKRVDRRGKQNGSASVVKFVTSASSTRSRTTNGSESGEGCPSASVGDSSGGSSDLLLNRFCQRRG